MFFATAAPLTIGIVIGIAAIIIHLATRWHGALWLIGIGSMSSSCGIIFLLFQHDVLMLTGGRASWMPTLTGVIQFAYLVFVTDFF